MRTILGMCGVLCLAFLWACTEVEILIPSHLPASRGPGIGDDPGKSPISLGDFKQIQTQRVVGLSCNLNGSRALKMNPEKQETPDWCWAATSKMVMAYHNGQTGKATHSQCQIASNSVQRESGGMECCPSETAASKSECMGGGWPSVVFDQYGFDYLSVAQALDWESLTKEICENRPFLYVVEFRGGGRHALVAAGYRTTISPGTNPAKMQQFVKVYDPTHNDFDYRTYDEFAGDVPSTNNSNTYYGVSHYRDYALIAPKDEGQL